MFVRTAAVVAALLVAPSALANADLTTAFSTTPSPALVYTTARYTVTVSNIGNKTANASTVAINLPATHTSPQVYVLGTVGAKSATCTQSGTRLDCTLGNIARNTSASVFFDIALPVSTAPFVFTATAATTSSENSTSNNGATRTAAQTFYPTSWGAGPIAVTNNHCTGTTLTSWYECTLFPSSISFHDTVLLAGGGISFPTAPDYTGSWSTNATDNSLHFEYYDSTGATVATFDGFGVDADCYEGLVHFATPTYVAPYEVCR